MATKLEMEKQIKFTKQVRETLKKELGRSPQFTDRMTHTYRLKYGASERGIKKVVKEIEDILKKNKFFGIEVTAGKNYGGGLIVLRVPFKKPRKEKLEE